MKPSEFVREYYAFAKDTEVKTGSDARLTLAQAALETGWGKNAVGNMFFGVKASKNTPIDKKQLLITREVLSHPNALFPEIISKTRRSDGKWEYRVKDWFRKYDTPEESFTDHANFFIQNKRYHKALDVKHDPYLFTEEIAKAGYATDPNYSSILKSVIRTVEKHLE